MVALEGSDPVGVLIGCKRPPQTFVLRIAVHPDWLRRGHGRHMLTSLSAKLAILGPKLLAADLPADNAAAIGLFEACGWRAAERYVDLDFAASSSAPNAVGVIQEVSLEELGAAVLPAAAAARSWGRTLGTLNARAEQMRGLAIASDERLEAALLFTGGPDEPVAVWAVTHERDDAGVAALRALLAAVAKRGGSITIPRVGDDEIELNRLAALGLTPGAGSIRYVSEATPG